MTNEQINIAIAEACGWKYEKNETHAPDGAFWWSKNPEFPDYCNNLNAMHEAESRFISDSSSAMTYAMLLLRVRGLAVVSEYDELNFDYCWHACHATARQRAEAFLKTIGKWKK